MAIYPINKNDLACTILTQNRLSNKDLLAIKKILIKKNPKRVNVWIDGSFNAETKKNGIGFVIENGEEYCYFGKQTRMSNSTDTELMGLAVALSYILDTYDFSECNDTCVKVYYDSSVIIEHIPDIIWCKQERSPYTNIKSVLKRYKRHDIDIMFEHVKAHEKNINNNIADAIAKYYSGISLTKREKSLIRNKIY